MGLTVTTKLPEVVTMMTKPTMALTTTTKLMVALIMTTIPVNLDDHSNHNT